MAENEFVVLKKVRGRALPPDAQAQAAASGVPLKQVALHTGFT